VAQFRKQKYITPGHSGVMFTDVKSADTKSWKVSGIQFENRSREMIQLPCNKYPVQVTKDKEILEYPCGIVNWLSSKKASFMVVYDNGYYSIFREADHTDTLSLLESNDRMRKKMYNKIIAIFKNGHSQDV
jgi:hypothetical protein